MQAAISCALENNTPYGALVVNVRNGEKIVCANTTSSGDKTEHAEMNALRKLNQLIYNDEEDLILYSTAEPCPMCMGAILWCGIKKVKFGISITVVKQFHGQIMVSAQRLNEHYHNDCVITGGVLEEQCFKLFKKLAS